MLIVFVPLYSSADTIVLKSGRRVDVEMAWEENDQIKGILSGVVVKYPKSKVERIERDQAEELNVQNKGFKFDVWYSGMNINDVMRIAEKNGKILQRGEMNSVQNNINPSVAAKFAEIPIKFFYKELLLNKSAAVELGLTPISKKLYTVFIRWCAPESSVTSEFINKVITSMLNKYGKSAKQTSGLLTNKYYWKINKNAIVALETGVDFVEIDYLDKAIEKSAKEEFQANEK
jgi:hypothetical protein